MKGLWILVGTVALVPAVALGDVFFRGLDPYTNVFDASGDGQFAIGNTYNFTTSRYEAARWNCATGKVQFLGVVSDDVASVGFGADFTGHTIVGHSGGADGQAFRWVDGAGMLGLGDFEGGHNSTGVAVSSNGHTIVGYGTDAEEHRQAFRWTEAGGIVGLGFLQGGTFSEAAAASADGSVIVGRGFEGASRMEAFRWTSGSGMVGLGSLLGGAISEAAGITADGSVITGFSRSSNGTEAFRWDAASGMVGLGDLPGGGFFSVARTISGNGDLIGGFGRTASASEVACVWDASHGMRSVQDVLEGEYGLDLFGWTLEEVRGISYDGMTWVGSGVNSSGQWGGWTAHVPEPSGLLALTALALISQRRRHMKGKLR